MPLLLSSETLVPPQLHLFVSLTLGNAREDPLPGWTLSLPPSHSGLGLMSLCPVPGGQQETSHARTISWIFQEGAGSHIRALPGPLTGNMTRGKARARAL